MPRDPGTYRTLGAYFNDDGINLMRDEWSDPKAVETRAFFKLTHAQIVDLQMLLYDELFRYAVAHPVKWTK